MTEAKLLNRVLRTVDKYYPFLVVHDSDINLELGCEVTTGQQYIQNITLVIDTDTEFKLVLTSNERKSDAWMVTELNKLIRSSVGSI